MKTYLMLMVAVLSIQVAFAQNANSSKGVRLVDQPEKHLLILGSGMFSEARQPLWAYDLTFRCLAPYQEGEWKGVERAVFVEDLINVPAIQNRLRIKAEKMFEKEKVANPDICKTDYQELVADPLALNQLNHYAAGLYEKMASTIQNVPAEESLPNDSPISICLNSLKLVEYLKQIAIQCAK